MSPWLVAAAAVTGALTFAGAFLAVRSQRRLVSAQVRDTMEATAVKQDQRNAELQARITAEFDERMATEEEARQRMWEVIEVRAENAVLKARILHLGAQVRALGGVPSDD
jgi:DNA polymerase III alpha subunit